MRRDDAVPFDHANVAAYLTMKRAQPELNMQKAVRQYLDIALPRDAFWTAFPSGYWRDGKFKGAMLKATGLVAGVPDILIVHEGRAIWIELKSDRGRLSGAQNATIERLLRSGSQCFLARSVQEVERDLRSVGVPLKATSDGWITRRKFAA